MNRRRLPPPWLRLPKRNTTCRSLRAMKAACLQILLRLALIHVRVAWTSRQAGSEIKPIFRRCKNQMALGTPSTKPRRRAHCDSLEPLPLRLPKSRQIPTLLHRNPVSPTPSGTSGHDLDAARPEPSQGSAKDNLGHAATPPRQSTPYVGPTSGSMTWQGDVEGPELLVIENGRANFGSVTGSPLPGVMCMVQISDSKHFSIAVAPAPSNQWGKVVLNVHGKGLMKVRLTWALP